MLGMTMAMNSEAAGGGASVVLEPEAETLIAAMTPEPDFARQIVINNLIVALKAAGIWSLLDILYVFAAHAQQPATLNWKAPANFVATPVSSPTFTVDRGFSGNGASAYLAPGWSPSDGPQYQQDSAHVSGWSLSPGSASATEQLVGTSTGTSPDILLGPRFTGDLFRMIVNDGTASSTIASTNRDGFFIANRSGASARQGYRNGASLGSDAVASTGETISALTFLRNGAATFASLLIAQGSTGASLSAPQVSSYYDALLSYMQAVGASSTTGFVLTDIASGRLFQRTKALTTGPVSASGTYSGGAPSAIELQVLKVSDNSVVKDWTTASGSVAGGAWSGTITGVPQGGSYYVKARPANATGLAQTGSNPFFVGIMLVVYGQSNAGGLYGGPAASPPAANPDTTWFNGSAWAAVPNTNGIRELLNDISSTFGVPAGALGAAVSGVTIGALSKGAGTGYYEACAAQIVAAGNDFEFLVWHQGEGNSAAGTPEAAYLASLDTLHGDFATDFGRTKTQAPLVLSGLATVTGGASGYGDDASWDAMERTLINAASLSGVTYSHSNRDAVIVNANVHYDGASYGRMGKRYARSITTLLGATSGFPNWHISASAVVDATTTTVDVTHGLGSDFTPTSGITGFEISGDNGATWSACTGVRTSATRITLTHASVATNSNRKLRYQYGLLPDMSAPVLDNSSLALPLDNSAGVLSPTPLAALPVPTWIVTKSTGNTFPTGSSTKWTSVGIGTASDNRFVILSMSNRAAESLTGATLQVAGQSDIALTVVNLTTTVGRVAFAYGTVPAAYGTTADITLQFSASIFNNPTLGVHTVDLTALNSTTPVASNATSVSGATSVSTNVATSAGGFVITTSTNTDTGGSAISFSGSETYATRTSLLHSSAMHGVGDASGVSANASSTATVSGPTSSNWSIGAISFR